MSCITVSLIYLIVGICGYLAYGNSINKNMIDAMRETFVNESTFGLKTSVLGFVVALMIVINVFISFALIMNGTLLAIEMGVSGAKTADDVGAWTSRLVGGGTKSAVCGGPADW